jgi:hypothetical protein
MKQMGIISSQEKIMSNLVHNEQTKMLASLFNNLGVVSLATGFRAPVMSVRPTAAPIGFSAGGYAIFDGLSINALGGMFFGALSRTHHCPP